MRREDALALAARMSQSRRPKSYRKPALAHFDEAPQISAHSCQSMNDSVAVRLRLRLASFAVSVRRHLIRLQSRTSNNASLSTRAHSVGDIVANCNVPVVCQENISVSNICGVDLSGVITDSDGIATEKPRHRGVKCARQLDKHASKTALGLYTGCSVLGFPSHRRFRSRATARSARWSPKLVVLTKRANSGFVNAHFALSSRLKPRDCRHGCVCLLRKATIPP